MSSSKKMALYRDFAEFVYLSKAQSPISPLPLTHCIRVFNIRREGGGRGGRVGPKSRGEGQQFIKLGRKYQHG
jgi:hypothetical protein